LDGGETRGGKNGKRKWGALSGEALQGNAKKKTGLNGEKKAEKKKGGPWVADWGTEKRGQTNARGAPKKKPRNC